jgi:hypothetical protein
MKILLSAIACNPYLGSENYFDLLRLECRPFAHSAYPCKTPPQRMVRSDLRWHPQEWRVKKDRSMHLLQQSQKMSAGIWALICRDN